MKNTKLNNEKTPQNPGEVLYDTLYRYFVLFGFPEDENKNLNENWGAVGGHFLWEKNPVWSVLIESLVSTENDGSNGNNGNNGNKENGDDHLRKAGRGKNQNNNSNNNTSNSNTNNNTNHTGRGERGGRRKLLSERDRVSRAQCLSAYGADRGTWGVFVGSHPVMIRCAVLLSHPSLSSLSL